jgi:hypothetical protein
MQQAWYYRESSERPWRKKKTEEEYIKVQG